MNNFSIETLREFLKNIVITERIANFFELVSVLAVLLIALLFQFAFHELPCPLCLLQRIGFIGIAYGVLLNLRFGFRPSHYAIIIFNGLFTAFVALRQIALHVIPGTPAYGSALFGWHLYTWSFVAAMLVVVGTTLLFSVDRQYQVQQRFVQSEKGIWFKKIIMATLVVVLVANIVGTLFECGLNSCPDNPTAYLWES